MGSTVYDLSDYNYIYNNPATFYPQSTVNPDRTVIENTAYTNFRAVLGRAPSQQEFNDTVNIFTASGVPGGQAYLQALNKGSIVPIVAQPTPTAAPPSQAADNTASAAVGIAAPATSSPGGTTSAYASQYSVPNLFLGPQAPTIAAPASDKTSGLIWVLVGAVFFYFVVFKHG